MSDYTLSAKVTGDASGFSKEMDAAHAKLEATKTKFEALGTKLGDIGKSMQTNGAKLSAALTLPVVVGAKACINAASDYEENLNKVDVAFGNSSKEVKAWSEQALKSFGLSKNQALEATSLFGDMATSMGLARPAAANMSTSLAGLAGDMASFKNIGIDEAMTALNGVFTGETESLKRVGIVMTEANLQSYALSQGITKSYQSMSQAEKVQLRYAYVMEMTKNAQGDYARTADGTANSIRTFQGTVDNLAIAFGQQLLPTFTPIIQKLTNLIEKFAALSPGTQQVIIKVALLAAALGPLLIVSGAVVRSVGSMFTAFSKMPGILSKVSAGYNAVKGAALGAGLRIGGMQGPIAAQGAKLSGLSMVLKKVALGFRTAGAAVKGFLIAFGPIMIAVAAVAGLIAYLWKTNEEFRKSITAAGQQIMSAVTPILQDLATVFSQIVKALAPVISQLAEALAPVLVSLAEALTPIVEALAPLLVLILGAIAKAIQALAPYIAKIVEIIATAIAIVISLIRPIVKFIASVIASIVRAVAPIVKTFADIFGRVFSTVSKIFDRIKDKIGAVFTGIKKAWGGLEDIVSTIFTGIYNAFKTVIDKVKAAFNFVLKGINGAVGIINKIPGVQIKKIEYLVSGTNNWQGGLAYMNEGGRGELTYLPNGSIVVPHDISTTYAKEAARTSGGQIAIDYDALAKAVANGVISIGGSLKDGMREAVDGMGMYIDKREIGRVVEVK